MVNDTKDGVCVLTHDLHPYGAQRVALSLVRSLVGVYRRPVEVVTIGGGELSMPMRRLAPIHALGAHWKEQVRSLKYVMPVLRKAGVRKAIANTVVVGHLAQALRSEGIEVVSLIHEMPALVKQEGLGDRLSAAHEHSKHVVYPHESVASAIGEAFPNLANWDRMRTLAQGVETSNPYRFDKARARAGVCATLGIDRSSKLVVAIGLADRRKGFDLFLDAALSSAVNNDRDALHYLWIGPTDARTVSEWKQRNGGRQPQSIPRFHWLGYQENVTPFYAAADLFVLASREDPFPYVAIEALNAATPLIAFRGSGGGAALAERGFGRVVDQHSGAILAAAIDAYLRDTEGLLNDGREGASVVDNEFRFDRYVERLLALLES